MPTVDINSPNESGIKKATGGLPLPVILIGIGGGLGLLTLVLRSSSGGGSSKNQTLLPNTAVMLGSLQQGVLDLQGKVTMGNADLSSQLTGVGENLGAQIDTQSQAIQSSFTDLSKFLGDNFAQMQGNENALASAIAQLGTQNVGLANSLTTVLGNLRNMDANASTWYNSLLTSQNNILSQLNALGEHQAAVAAATSSSSGLPIIGSIGPATQELSSGPGTTPKILSGDRGFTAQLSADKSKIIVNWQNLQDQGGQSYFNLMSDQDIWATYYGTSNKLSGTSGTATIDLGAYRLNPEVHYRIVQMQPQFGGGGNHLSFSGNQLTG